MEGNARKSDVLGLDKDGGSSRKEGSHVETPTITGRHDEDGAEATETTGLSRLVEVRDMKRM